MITSDNAIVDDIKIQNQCSVCLCRFAQEFTSILICIFHFQISIESVFKIKQITENSV